MIPSAVFWGCVEEFRCCPPWLGRTRGYLHSRVQGSGPLLVLEYYCYPSSPDLFYIADIHWVNH